MTKEMNPHVKMSCEVKLMRCPECKKEMKLAVAIGEDIRNTWCMNCRQAVIWQAVNK